MPKAKKAASDRTCPKCWKEFTRCSDMHRHLNDVHHRTRTYKCPEESCTYENSQESNCRRHMRSCHRNFKKKDPIVLVLVEVESGDPSASSSSSSRLASPPVTPATPDYDYFALAASGSVPASGSGTPGHPPLLRSNSAPTNLSLHADSRPYFSHQAQGYQGMPFPQERHSMPELANLPVRRDISTTVPRALSLDSAAPSWAQAPNPGHFLGLAGLSLPGISPPEPSTMQLYENGVGPAYLEPLDLGAAVDSPQPQIADAASIQRAPTPVLPLPHLTEDELTTIDTGRDMSDAELLEVGIPPRPNPVWETEEDEELLPSLQAFLASRASF